jgi:hypothetical protein
MNYSTVFATSAAAERFVIIAGKVAVRAFGFTVWAISLTALAFANGCVNSCQLGRGARAWWDATGRDWCAAEIEPCIATLSAATAWAFGVERCWSVQNMPITLAANARFCAEIKADYLAAGDRAVRFVVAFTDKACTLSTAGVRLLSA